MVHIGAGSGAELPVYREFSRTRILLIEPQPDMAGRLRRDTAAMPNVEVRQLAVAAQDGEATLQLFNLPGFSGLQRPTGLSELFPGLAPAGAVTVQTASLPDLVAAHGIERAANNWLVLDAPGAAAVVTDTLAGNGLDEYFSHVFFHAGRNELFEGVEPFGVLMDQLRPLGYQLVGDTDQRDPDLPGYHLWRNDALRELTRAKDQLAARAQGLDGEAAAYKRRADEAEASLATSEQQMDALRNQLAESERAAAERQESTQRRVAGLESALAAKARELDNLRETSLQHQARYERALEAKQKQLLAMQEAAQQGEREIKADLDRTKADLSVAIRTQALREADLKELQGRYAAAIEMRDQQHELLVKLRDRLGGAAKYLKRIDAGVAASAGRELE